MRKEYRIYFTEDGFTIDLKRIIAIGKVSKDKANNIYLPIHVETIKTPLHYVVGNCIGLIPETSKQRIELNRNSLIEAWRAYKEWEERGDVPG